MQYELVENNAQTNNGVIIILKYISDKRINFMVLNCKSFENNAHISGSLSQKYLTLRNIDHTIYRNVLSLKIIGNISLYFYF